MLPARILIPLLWALGLLNLANGAWMLLHAWSWFQWIPGVSDTGAANAHFIHDVGWPTRSAASVSSTVPGIPRRGVRYFSA